MNVFLHDTFVFCAKRQDASIALSVISECIREKWGAVFLSFDVFSSFWYEPCMWLPWKHSAMALYCLCLTYNVNKSAVKSH